MLLYYIFTRLLDYHNHLVKDFKNYECVTINLAIDAMVLTSIDFFCRTIDDRYKFVNGLDYDDLGAVLYMEKQYAKLENYDIPGIDQAIGTWEPKLIFEGLIYFKDD